MSSARGPSVRPVGVRAAPESKPPTSTSGAPSVASKPTFATVMRIQQTHKPVPRDNEGICDWDAGRDRLPAPRPLPPAGSSSRRIVSKPLARFEKRQLKARYQQQQQQAGAPPPPPKPSAPSVLMRRVMPAARSQRFSQALSQPIAASTTSGDLQLELFGVRDYINITYAPQEQQAAEDGDDAGAGDGAGAGYASPATPASKNATLAPTAAPAEPAAEPATDDAPADAAEPAAEAVPAAEADAAAGADGAATDAP